MIIPLNRLISFNENRYIFTRAAMQAVDQLSYLSNDIKSDETWKTVPNILELFLNERMKYMVNENAEQGPADVPEEGETE